MNKNLLWLEGKLIIMLCVVATILGFFLFKPIIYLALGFFLFSLYFFRNPERTCKKALDDRLFLVSPADGKVIEVSDNLSLNAYQKKISIFLSPLDVHVNWIPCSGAIERITYHKGAFYPAFTEKSSLLNERNDIVIKAENRRKILVRQIAGTVARRIVCWVKDGQAVNVCQKYGMIKFGSRVEIFLPDDVNVAVTVGQKVVGGQSILGRWRGAKS